MLRENLIYYLKQSFRKDLEDEDDPFEKYKFKISIQERCYLSEIYSLLKEKGYRNVADKYAVIIFIYFTVIVLLHVFFKLNFHFRTR